MLVFELWKLKVGKFDPVDKVVGWERVGRNGVTGEVVCSGVCDVLPFLLAWRGPAAPLGMIHFHHRFTLQEMGILGDFRGIHY